MAQLMVQFRLKRQHCLLRVLFHLQSALYKVATGLNFPNDRRSVLLISPTVAYESTASQISGIRLPLPAAVSSSRFNA
jgi:hypothetical protein